MHGRLIADGRVRSAVHALIFASLASLAMLVGRAAYLKHWELRFYIWNLLLAWLPLIFALRAYRLAAVRPAPWWPLGVCAILWFLFFPNAPYLVTDFLHLKGRPPLPAWFDIVMMMSFAWTGLLLGYLSLMLMQETVRFRRGPIFGWTFAVTMLALSSYGIYLGRFARWNSWDVLVRPDGLVDDALHRAHFHSNPEMYMFLAMFFCFSLLSYAPLYALTHLRHHPPDSEAAPPPL